MINLRISENRRYFVGQDGTPFFWLGDTQWELFRLYTLEEARTILEIRKAQGFTVFQIMMTGVGDGTAPDLDGGAPWRGNDPAQPDESYFRRADSIIEAAREIGMVLVIGVFHQLQRDRITPANARAYARWLASRYKNAPHIAWSMYPEAKIEYLPVLRELAAGLREGDGGSHLITAHPDPSPTSSSFINEEPWLDFHSIQTCVDYQLLVPMVAADYNRKPVRPVVMAEGGYEGPQFGKLQTPLEIRKQAYWSHLAGGHHTYGHNGCWREQGEWRDWIQSEGARQLTVYEEIVCSCPAWWHGVPEQSILAGDPGEGLNINTAMRSAAGNWILVYLSHNAPISIRLDSLTAAPEADAVWIDPRSGAETPIGRVPASGFRTFAPPAGWPDAVLRVTT